MGKSIITSAAAGMAAGAAGTTALNVVTYADMAWRERPSSSAPGELVERAAERAGTSIPGEGDGGHLRGPAPRALKESLINRNLSCPRQSRRDRDLEIDTLSAGATRDGHLWRIRAACLVR